VSGAGLAGWVPPATDGSPILLVEDDPDDVALIMRAFRRANLANPVTVAHDGEEAVAYLSGGGVYADRSSSPLPVLILLDLKVPRRSGHEVLEWIQAQDGLRRIPVAVLTSSRERRDVDKAYDLGANAYLVKPVDFEELLRMVTSLHMFWLMLNEPPEVVP
jgi:CheY-like chemotaxis protein